MTRCAADGLGGLLDTVADGLARANVVGFDETSLLVVGRPAWLRRVRADIRSAI
jgi:hypothetical protein